MFRKTLFLGFAALALWPGISAGLALITGVLFALTFGDPFGERARALTSPLLSLAVVGLGAGMNLVTVGKVGLAGLGYTVGSITAALLLGWAIGRWLKLQDNVAWLITMGTAICGGSAIAAVAPVLRAKSHEVTASLAIVFLLNALALFLFPPLGHALHLTQEQFGLWSALAIHDTSSVVGATMQYGARALEIGTTVKLARALWIVPLTFGLDALVARRGIADREETRGPKRPWFILGFLVVAGIFTWSPGLARYAGWVDTGAKRLLVLTLFLIGSNLSRATLAAVGPKPILFGVILWVLMGGGTLLIV